ncbi:MAG TPA: hypothetical protein VLT47_10835 [Anaeromyxobacteraceae bacterium]|nr:hypothetical protein [Anaeromyxobacteraceae bacterium]
MGALDWIRQKLRTPAEMRMFRAEAEHEAWKSAAKPAASTAMVLRSQGVGGGLGQPPGRTPSIDWTRDTPPEQPVVFQYTEGYSGHAYQSFAAPLNFDGFSLDAIRAVCKQHRQGYFYNSSALMIAALGVAPVQAALAQAVAPILALPRHVTGGDKGLSKLITSELEEMLVPRSGLRPSPFLPPAVWGTTAIHLRMMGFNTWQHITGDPDDYTGVRPIYTRNWPVWGVQRYRSPRKTIAYTTEGPVEVCNDGHFTLIEDVEEAHLYDAAILSLGEEGARVKLTQEARTAWLDFFASPKLVALLPENVPTEGPLGDLFRAALESIYGPDGRGILPHKADVKAVSISGEGANQFQGALLDAIVHIFMVLVGSAGTVGNGMNTGAGQTYQPAKSGSWKVLDSLIRRPTLAMARAINGGICAPYQDINYGDQIQRARRAGAWKDVALSIPVPDTDRDERIESLIGREKARCDIIAARRANGIAVPQDEADHIADELEVRRVPLADLEPAVGEIEDTHIKNKLVSPDEVRARLGLPPLPNGAGSVERLAEERLAGGDEAGALAKVDAAATKDAGEAEDVATEDAPEDGGEGPRTLPSGKAPPPGQARAIGWTDPPLGEHDAPPIVAKERT